MSGHKSKQELVSFNSMIKICLINDAKVPPFSFNDHLTTKIPSAMTVFTFEGLLYFIFSFKKWKTDDFLFSRNDPSGFKKHGGSGKNWHWKTIFKSIFFLTDKCNNLPNISRVPLIFKILATSWCPPPPKLWGRNFWFLKKFYGG